MELEKKLKIYRWVFGIAGFFIMFSMLLGHLVDHRFYYFTLFVGANLFQFSITGFCPMVMILDKLGVGSEK